MIKVGSEVVVNQSSDIKRLHGKRGIIVGTLVAEMYPVMLDGEEKPIFLRPSSFSLAPQQEKEKMKKENAPWSFNVLSDYDIVWGEVKDDLSHASPIACISVVERKPVPTPVTKKRAVRDDKGDLVMDESGKKPLRKITTEIENVMTDVEDRYVAIHHSILNKAIELGKALPFFQKPTNEPQVLSLKKEQQFSEYVQYVKDIRQSPWPEALHKKAKVTVTKPNI